MFNIFNNIVNNICHLSPILPLMLYLYKYKKIIEPSQPFLIYLYLCVFFEIITFFTEYYKIVDHLILNIFYVLELILLSFYFKNLFKNKYFINITYFFLVLFMVLAFYMFGIKPDVFKVNELLKTSSALIIICYSIFFFVELIQNFEPKKLIKDSKFIIVGGMFFYFCALFVYALFSRDIMWGEHNLALRIYTMIMIFTIFYRIILSIGIWQMEQKK